MKNFVVLRRAIGEEVQKVSDSLNGNIAVNLLNMLNENSHYFDSALETVQEWMRFVVCCKDREVTSWGAEIGENIITLPTGEVIRFDEVGALFGVNANGEEASKDDIWSNATTIVSNNSFKVISDNSMDVDGHGYNITLIGWKPTYSDEHKTTKCGNIAYEEYLIVIGGIFDTETLYQDNKEGLSNAQTLYEYAIGDLLAKNKYEINIWKDNSVFGNVCDEMEAEAEKELEEMEEIED